MEGYLENIHKFKIPVQTSPDSGSTKGYGFIHKTGNNRTLDFNPQFDFFLPLFLTRTGNLLEYVDISIEDSVFVMPRQEVNPYYIEFQFFDTIKRNKVNNGDDLTVLMMNFIRSERPELLSFLDIELKYWFDNFGRYEFPWDAGITLDNIDKIALVNENIISKAFFHNITINK